MFTVTGARLVSRGRLVGVGETGVCGGRWIGVGGDWCVGALSTISDVEECASVV